MSQPPSENVNVERGLIGSNLRKVRNSCPVVPAKAGTQRGWEQFWQTVTWSYDLTVQILPLGVGFLYQSELPLAMPVLESFLPDDCAFRRRVCLVPNECMDTVHLGAPFNEVVPVLPDSLHKIRGHAYVQGAVALACEDVYAGDPLCLVAWVWHVFGSRLRSLGSGPVSGYGAGSPPERRGVCRNDGGLTRSMCWLRLWRGRTRRR